MRGSAEADLHMSRTERREGEVDQSLPGRHGRPLHLRPLRIQPGDHHTQPQL